MIAPASVRGVLARVAIAAALLFVIGLTLHRFSELDRQFLAPSWAGARGLAHYLLRDYRRAASGYRQHVRNAVAVQGGLPDAGFDALIRDDLHVARQTAQAQLATRPRSVSALLTLGAVAVEERHSEEAMQTLQRVLEIEPDQFDALLLSATVYARSRDYGRAIDAVNRALRHDRLQSRVTTFLTALETMGELSALPKPEKPVCLLAQYHRYLRIFDAGQARVARRYAELAIEHGDYPADAYLVKGIVIYWDRRRPEEALSAFLKAVAAEPHHAEAFRWAARAYGDQGELGQEARLLRAAQEAAPDDPYYVFALDHILVDKLGDFHQATELYRRLLARKRGEVSVLRRLGYVSSFVGDEAQTVAAYQQAARAAPTDAALYEEMGESLGRIRRHDEALRAFRRAIELDPTRSGAYFGLGGEYFDRRRYAEALAEYERGFALGGRGLGRLRNLCQLYNLTSAFERAARCYDAALAQDPDDLETFRRRNDNLKDMKIRGVRP
jgi:tetratricopeptide (TPR) repeat protein